MDATAAALSLLLKPSEAILHRLIAASADEASLQRDITWFSYHRRDKALRVPVLLLEIGAG